MLSVKQGGIKYHFLSLWYDSTWDWTPGSRAFGEHYALRSHNYGNIFKMIVLRMQRLTCKMSFETFESSSSVLDNDRFPIIFQYKPVGNQEKVYW